MDIAIIDDELEWRQRERSYLEKFYGDIPTHIDLYDSGVTFLNTEKKYDIVIVDIEMPQKDGFETIKEYKKFYNDSINIILTTHMEISRKGYLVNAFRYVDKTNMAEELHEALTAADILLESNNTIYFNVIGRGKKAIRVKDIIYIETEKRNILVHTSEDVWECSNSIDALEKELIPYGFYRSHRSYLINVDKVKRFDHRNIYFRENEVAILSSRKYVDFKKKYMDRTFSVSSG